MLMTGETLFISTKMGTKKNGENWYAGKFLDNDADEFFSVFVDENLFNKMKSLSKHTPVVLTLNLVPGQKYFSMESIEIVKN